MWTTASEKKLMAQLSNYKQPFLPLIDDEHSVLLYKILSSTLLNNNLFGY